MVQSGAYTAGTPTSRSRSEFRLAIPVIASVEELIDRVGLVSGIVAVLDREPYGRWIGVASTEALVGTAHLNGPAPHYPRSVGLPDA